MARVFIGGALLTLSISILAARADERAPEQAVAGLEVAEGLQAQLFAAEPMLFSPSNIDVDHLGRIWVCEIVNYRPFRNKHPMRETGDRILVLEDTNGDGVADKSTVFYEGKDIESPHGVCVLGSKVIVSAGANVWVMTDEDGDLKADKKELLFTGIEGAQHDHGIHSFLFGPDGKLYFNFGNAGVRLKDKHGKPVVDTAGNVVEAGRKPYQEGMIFRCNLDGSEVETLAWNFRNNWELAVDSFGTIWQSDNDDDGNQGVRINYVMEFGNYGYKDEMTGAGWQTPRTNMEADIPSRHWYLNDPGVVPNLLLTGAGSPTGICIYEGDLLPEVFQGQIIHCDAGPNIVRAYPVENDGAGYKASIVNILEGTRDKWFRPSDVCVAPDGSLIIADWYDPGVGGHAQGDATRGRIFRVAPTGNTNYTVPKFDFSTPEGAVEALKNPNSAVRYMAWTALTEMGAKAMPALLEKLNSDNHRLRARALWVVLNLRLGDGDDDASEQIASIHGQAGRDADPNIRIAALRAARRAYGPGNPHPILIGHELLKEDPSIQVRRECAISLRYVSEASPDTWAVLAAQHDGKDRWYLEALGIGAEGRWDEFLDAWLAKVGDQWNTPAGRDIIWRSRAKKTPEYLVKILKDPATPKKDHPRYMRAFDFLTGPEKEKALESLLDL